MTFIYLVNAGGIGIDESTFTINGSKKPFLTSINHGLTFEFIADQYVYGRHGDNGYIIFVLKRVGDVEISSSVGKNRTNTPSDVKLVKDILYQNGYYNGNSDVHFNDEFDKAIREFQLAIGFSKPDGIIDPNGNTIKKLSEYSDCILISPLKEGESDILYRLRTDQASNRFISIGTYEVNYCHRPIFHSEIGLPYIRNRYDRFQHRNQYEYDRNRCIYRCMNQCVGRYGKDRCINQCIDQCDRDNSMSELLPIRGRAKDDIIKILPAYSPSPIGKLSITITGQQDEHALYLKVNGKVPGIGTSAFGGISDKPIKFSWEVRPPELTMKFRHRILPDTTWTSWSNSILYEVFYLLKGSHVFELEGKYLQENNQDWNILKSVRYSLNLEQTFIAKPKNTIYKASSVDINKYKFQNIPKNFYKTKKALLIGVEQYDDLTFSPLPYVENDIDLMKSALVAQEFDVEVYQNKRVNSINFIDFLQNKINSSNKEDFILIYISSHGFNIHTKSFIATSDCKRNTSDNCFPFDRLEQMVKLENHNAKHIMIFLDACSAGMGIIDKDSRYPEERMVAKRGVLVMTAGLENQTAQMVTDPKMQCSVFTHFLVKGLNGDADILKDGTISATELLLYTRYNVASYTSGMQVPMMGRVSGSGEMVFQLSQK